MRELGSVYEKLWEMLTASHGPKEASRVLSRILGATLEHGEEAVSEALEAALAQGRCDLLSLGEHLHDDGREQVGNVEVPEALRGYRVEAARASDYDWLLEVESSEAELSEARQEGPGPHLSAEMEGSS